MLLESSPRVFPVILDFRSPEDTRACVQSLRASTYRAQFPVIVDNSPGGEEAEELRETLFPLRVLVAGENLGYAGGNNLGIRHALEHDADLVWILNPDTVVEADALEHLLESARAHPEVGLWGPRVLYGGSDPPVIASDGGLLGDPDGVGIRHLHDGEPDHDHPPAGLIEPDYVTGSSLLVRAAVLREVGLLDERYFLYFEETDYALRARQEGWRVAVQPRARVHHFRRSSGRLPTPHYVYYYIRGRFLFDRAHAHIGWATTNRALDEFIEGWRERVARGAPEWLETFDDLVERAVADGLAGRGGRCDTVHEIPGPPDRD